ncbi:MAG TPA: type II toxin-antitoxin system HicA family toxin [Armatimonadota bacterium]
MPKEPRVNARETIAALRRAGFEEMRITGSHTFMVHHEQKRSTVVPEHGGHDLALGTLHRILEQAGLSVEEFIANLK